MHTAPGHGTGRAHCMSHDENMSRIALRPSKSVVAHSGSSCRWRQRGRLRSSGGLRRGRLRSGGGLRRGGPDLRA
eukprot:1257192-Rhodomonas_salina.1